MRQWVIALAVLAAAGGVVVPVRAEPNGEDAKVARQRTVIVRYVPVVAEASSGNAGVFVGINQFTEDEKLRTLDCAVNDAVGQAYAFVVELKLIPARNCWLSLSGEPSTEEARGQLKELEAAGVRRVSGLRSAVLKSVVAAREIARDASDLVVVSMSTHGFEDERGVAYAMPADGLIGMLRESAIDVAAMKQSLRDSKAGKRIMLMDACREKPAGDARGGESTMGRAFRQALAAAEGQATLASCDAGQVSIEDKQLGHGVFTYYLLEGLHGKAATDARGFVTLGSLSQYVSDGVSDWIVAHKAGMKRSDAQRPFFDGPEAARQIPLAVDSGIKAKLAEAKARTNEVMEKLKLRVSRREGFTWDLYTRLCDALEKSEGGEDLLLTAGDFAEGKMREGPFVAYLTQMLETPEQRASRVAREQADRQAAEQQAKIEFLWSLAKANDSKEKGREGQQYIDQILAIQPGHKEAIALRERISAYYGPGKIGETWTNSIGMSFAYVPAGEFVMGSPAGEPNRNDHEGPQHKVRFVRPLLIGVTEVTQAQWMKIMGSNPSHITSNENMPVDKVSWNDAIEFCKKLGQRDGKTYRLPSEAEWEYACRAGATGPMNRESLDGVAWHHANSASTVHPVGAKRPNAWGIFDMQGNVMEWCQDGYHSSYDGAPDDGRAWTGDGSSYILRGGSWNFTESQCRPAHRDHSSPLTKIINLGFRVAMDLQ